MNLISLCKHAGMPSFVALTVIATTFTTPMAVAQVAGETTQVSTTVSESTHTAMGWSVKKTLMGKNIYNDLGQKVGEVEDLIIAPDRNVSYVIVGAGGFIGIGRHDVAISVAQIQNKAGKLVMPGATKDSVKLLSAFTYANNNNNNTDRDQFLALADQDIARGKAKVVDLEKDVVNASQELKAGITQRMNRLDIDVKAAQAKLDEMRRADVARWRSYEAGVNAATDRLRKSMVTAAA